MLSKTWKDRKDRKDKMKEKDKLNAKRGKLGMSEIGCLKRVCAWMINFQITLLTQGFCDLEKPIFLVSPASL